MMAVATYFADLWLIGVQWLPVTWSLKYDYLLMLFMIMSSSAHWGVVFGNRDICVYSQLL